ncbi:class I SAM-dependent methyltransferase [Paenactinomyces guangxiensis]|uniref:Phospholipid methyltransferase n=1 Tax=Paenactinomyces guangxiensis TaxID=1490290 RepID=A0A7W1WTL3_9BACL|nr:phospholipid methyltransferase [Paenactinomyces guangxiensis]MBA4495763.1 phospholipid methyltransferase [Paenactinomyces guangxiensis]MBH8592752.1 phospholipid methyltransferase [Paenactinomyces guangxiensis]
MREGIRSLTDTIRFFYTFIRSPHQVGSIIPSSKFLANAMFKKVRWGEVSTIAELGAGTGVFTRHIYENKREGSIAIIFEQDCKLRQYLKKKYPGLCYYSNARDLKQTLVKLGISHVDLIICSLPFAIFPQSLRDEILEGVFQTLKPGGFFIAFQYSLQMKNQLTEIFSSVDLSVVPLNIPPAIVYTCAKE